MCQICHFYSEIIFGQLSIDIWQFLSGHTASYMEVRRSNLVIGKMYIPSTILKRRKLRNKRPGKV